MHDYGGTKFFSALDCLGGPSKIGEKWGDLPFLGGPEIYILLGGPSLVSSAINI